MKNGLIADDDGNKFWYRNGKLHREDGPAIERSDGGKRLFIFDKRNRENLYAGERANGAKVWYKNGELHRLDGPAVELSDGSKEWRVNGLLHREDGPAVEYHDGTRRWYKYGRLHRFNGPAVYNIIDRTTEYWINGKRYTEDGKEYKKEKFQLYRFIKNIAGLK